MNMEQMLEPDMAGETEVPEKIYPNTTFFTTHLNDLAWAQTPAGDKPPEEWRVCHSVRRLIAI
jgi:hypothetical protein